MPSSSRRRNSAGAVPWLRPRAARYWRSSRCRLLLPIMVLSRTVDLVRMRTAESMSTAGGGPMATKRRPLQAARTVRPLGGRTVRPLAARPVMITGAASGIGRSLARRLSRLGSPAAIADIDEAGLKETAQDAAGAGAGPGARRAGRRGPAPLRGRGARVAALAGWPGAAGRGVQQRGRRGRLLGARRRPRTTTSGCGRSTSTGWSTAPAPSCPSWSSRTTGSSSTPRACSAWWACPTRAPTARRSSRCAASPTRCARSCAAPASAR